ncbi:MULTISPECIES: hypothetical protein [unclassified Tenacibaculum]|uniref:hypothetical protein n=1 Tax=unclassified Tenacibaculum TaxID=2635139 RepID=UPI001F2D0DE0|nr:MULTISPECIES: hypothetical protein [unclassified Tenacibaculum]MCF2875979.1 hypothetical protein [Tenacibaculum sp. Cn5-1]MCF2936054.1 hypothetical protein [Tenacibaculum sp. Cn5-34]MCG7512615.1 hypothetical protein [Tenacibaculum sp. Cn5-46]
MEFKLVTYKTVRGTKKILELKSYKATEAIIYKDGSPCFYVDCFDLRTESNVIMNSMVLCRQQKLKKVIKEIGRINKVNISIQKAPFLSVKKKVELKKIELPPLPKKWLI